MAATGPVDWLGAGAGASFDELWAGATVAEVSAAADGVFFSITI